MGVLAAVRALNAIITGRPRAARSLTRGPHVSARSNGPVIPTAVSRGRYSNALRIVLPPHWLSVHPRPGLHTGSSRRREEAIRYRRECIMDCPLARRTVSSSSQQCHVWSGALPDLGELGLSWSACQLPAASFKGVLGFTSLFSLRNGNARRAIAKGRQSF